MEPDPMNKFKNPHMMCWGWVARATFPIKSHSLLNIWNPVGWILCIITFYNVACPEMVHQGGWAVPCRETTSGSRKEATALTMVLSAGGTCLLCPFCGFHPNADLPVPSPIPLWLHVINFDAGWYTMPHATRPHTWQLLTHTQYCLEGGLNYWMGPRIRNTPLTRHLYYGQDRSIR